MICLICSTTQILLRKLIFAEGGKPENITLGVRLRSTNHSSRTSPGWNPHHNGGGEDDGHCANPTPLVVVVFALVVVIVVFQRGDGFGDSH